MYEEVDFTKFWDFREDEEPLLRLIRVTVACSLGFRPPAPFGDCESCPNKQVCWAVNQGRLAAAKWRMANKEPTLEGCPTDEEMQLIQNAADQEVQNENDGLYPMW